MYQVFKGLTLLLLFVWYTGTYAQSTNPSHNNVAPIDSLRNADLYCQINALEKALEILQQQLLEESDSSRKAIIHYKMAHIYLEQGQFNFALSYLKKFQSYQEAQNDSLGIIKARIGLAEYYRKQNQYNDASSLLYSVLNTTQLQNNRDIKVLALLGLSKLSIQTNRYSEAKSYAQQALNISRQINAPVLEMKSLDVFVLLYRTLGDYQAAFKYKCNVSDLKDSVVISQLGYLLGEESYNKNTQLADINDESIHIASIGIKEEHTTRVYIIALSLLGIFALVFFILFRSKVVMSRKLKMKNKELEKLNATKDKFFSIIAHDLKSPFNSLMGFSEVLSLQVENKSYKEIVNYSRSIHNSTRKLFSLVETLLQWSRTQLGTTEYKPEKMDVRIVTSNIVSILKINAEEKDIVISVDVDDYLIAWADKDLFSAVLRNLISNAIKFSRIGSVINVSGKTKGSFIEMAVTDTGVGISKDNLQKIFRVDTNITTAGTLNEKGTGLGLVLCKEFVEINKGTIAAESKLEKGSTFKFTVPLSTNLN